MFKILPAYSINSSNSFWKSFWKFFGDFDELDFLSSFGDFEFSDKVLKISKEQMFVMPKKYIVRCYKWKLLLENQFHINK